MSNLSSENLLTMKGEVLILDGEHNSFDDQPFWSFKLGDKKQNIVLENERYERLVSLNKNDLKLLIAHLVNLVVEMDGE